MFSKSLLLSAAIFSTTITAQELLNNRSLENRATRSLGGYALLTTLCPNDMDQCGGPNYCCPTTLTCIVEGYVDNVCCPGSLNCWAALDAAPYCADDTWTLWDQSAGGIVLHQYFCCAPGLVGTVAGKCADADTISTSNPQAIALAPGGAVLGPGAATSTTVVVVSPTGSAVVVTSTSSAAVVVSPSTTVKTLTSTSGTSNASTASTSSSKSLTTSSSTTTSTLTPATTASGTGSSSSSASPSATKASGATAGNGVAGVVLFVQFVVGIWLGLF